MKFDIDKLNEVYRDELGPPENNSDLIARIAARIAIEELVRQNNEPCQTPNREQQLIDICFDLVFTVLDHDHAAKFIKMTQEQKGKWVAERLRGCGFDTAPVGCSWGVLKTS